MYLPLLMNLEKQKVIVIGGGKIALRKIKKIVAFGGSVTCISPEFEAELLHLAHVECITDCYHKHYLTKGLIIAATNQRDLNEKIYQDCHEQGLLCMRIDDGESSDFIFSATEQTEELIISISTKGKNPAKAKQICQEIMAYLASKGEDMDASNLNIKENGKNDY